MHIDAVEIYHLKLPLAEPLPSALGEVAAVETVLVRLCSGDLSGWGEASPGAAPTDSPDWSGGVFACLSRWLAPAIADTTVETGEDLTERLAAVRGNRYAKAAIDLAWWDLLARERRQSLRDAIGAPARPLRLAVTLDVPYRDGEPSIDALIEQIGEQMAAGCAHVTLKLRPGWDLEVVRAARQMFAQLPLRVDCDGRCTSEHLDLFYRLDDFGLDAIQQPFAADDLVAHAMLAEQIHTPLCLGQSISGPRRLEQAIDLGACACVNLPPDRCGGLTPALAMHDTCAEADVACSMSIGLRSAIGVRAAMALAAKSNYLGAVELPPPYALLAEDFAPRPQITRDADGAAIVVCSDEPGIGLEPDAAMLGRVSIASEQF